MAYYYQPYIYPQPASIYQYAFVGDQPYGLNVMDYYPAAQPMQVVPMAPWGSYAGYVHDVSRRRAYDAGWYRQRAHSPIDPTEAHNTIQDALRELQARVNAFNFPGRLDFEDSPGDGQVPKLADTKRNSAVNEHKQKLEELIKTLEGVKSHGDRAVKKAKAGAIERVKEEIEELKRKKAVIWYTQAQGENRSHKKRFWAIW